MIFKYWHAKFYFGYFVYEHHIYIEQRLFVANFEILHCSNVFARRHNIFKPESIFKQTRQFFYRENTTSFINYVTATLRALIAWRGHMICDEGDIKRFIFINITIIKISKIWIKGPED